MSYQPEFWTTRRVLLGGGLAAIAASVLAPSVPFARTPPPVRLTAGPATARLIGPGEPETPVLAYNGRVPGPVLRGAQGATLEVVLENRLAEPTTLHWHGLRLPNGMDGVPYLTQAPVKPGESFTYKLPLKDAGTFWYHPHINSSEQIGRGLLGALIVDEPAPPAVDRDLLWVLDDWRLTKEGRIHESFGSPHDRFHNGRLGNVATVNGSGEGTFGVVSGERIRLRLVNAANARIFGLDFGALDPWLIALDANPVPPVKLGGAPLTLAPGQRADLILDISGATSAAADILDVHYSEQRYRLISLVAGKPDRPGLAGSAAPTALAANPISAPDLANAQTVAFSFDGGMHSNLTEAMLGDEKLPFRDIARRGMAWTINDRVHPPMTGHHTDQPLAQLERGRSYRFDLENRSDWEHPIHLHGHSFLVLGADGQPARNASFTDTVLLDAGQRRSIAFVADNPGDWMFHCHILEHQEAGMMGFVRVTA